jgi:hypothetical protein
MFYQNNAFSQNVEICNLRASLQTLYLEHTHSVQFDWNQLRQNTSNGLLHVVVLLGLANIMLKSTAKCAIAQSND